MKKKINCEFTVVGNLEEIDQFESRLVSLGGKKLCLSFDIKSSHVDYDLLIWREDDK